ncbi:mRNA 3' end processing factor [Tilletia horrida]|nr:mRNA 3' end processing factor [Tilletia horrida]
MYSRQPYPPQQRYAGPPPQQGYHQRAPQGYQQGGRQGQYPNQPNYPPQHGHPGQYPQYPPHSQHAAQPPPPSQSASLLPHPMIAHDPQAFEQMFKDHLASLVVNSKPIITNLTILAHDHAPKMHHVISNALEQHLFTAPIPMRLPALYLVDSISKNIGQPYTTNWSGIITRLFLETFRVVDAPTRKRLEELLATWRTGGPNGTPLFGESAQWTIERSLYGTQQNPHGLAHQLAAKDSENAMRSPLTVHGQHPQVAHAQASNAHQGYRSPMGAHGYSQAGPSHHAAHQQPPPPSAPRAMLQGTSGHASPSHPSAAAGGSAANTLIASLLQAGLLAQDSRSTPPVAEPEQDDGYVRMLMNLDISLNSGPSDWAKVVQNQLQMQGHNGFDPLELVLHHRGMPATCKQCANRYSATREGQRALDEHLDWHFRQNRRAKDSAARGQSRSWFTGIEIWIRSGFDDTVPNSSSGETGGDGMQAGRSAEDEAALRAKHQATIVVAPTDAEVAAKPCPICKEKFQSEWSEDEEDWIWRNAVLVDGIYCHASCHASAKVMSEKVTRGGTPEAGVRAKSPQGSQAGSHPPTPLHQVSALPATDDSKGAVEAGQGRQTISDPIARVKVEEGLIPSSSSSSSEASTASRKRKESPSVAEAAASGEDVRVKRERLSD